MSRPSCTSRCLLLLIGLLAGTAWAEPMEKLKEWGDRGAQLYKDGKYEDAAYAFAQAYTVRPLPLFLFNIAQARRKAGQVPEAIAMYERYLREDPGPGMRAEAQGYLADLKGKSPGSVKEFSEMGAQLYKSGEYGKAIQAFEKAYALMPSPVFLFNIAQARRKAGQYREALPLYERYLVVDPHSSMVGEAKGYIKELRVRLDAENKALLMRQQAMSAMKEMGDKQPPPPRPQHPLYRRAWFWGVIGGAAAGIALGVTLGVVLRPHAMP